MRPGERERGRPAGGGGSFGGGPPRGSSWDDLALPLPGKLARDIASTGRIPRDGDNLGLWLDKLVHRNRMAWTLDKDDRTRALGAFCKAWRSPPGKAGLDRLRESIAVLHPDPSLHWTATGRLNGRLLVDYGRSTVTETSVSLHPLWGVPRIPGSALKGITRAEMGLEGMTGEEVELIFGNAPPTAHQGAGAYDSQRGGIVFYDAYPVDGSFSLALDVLTPHHREYYDGKGPPADWEDPIPHSFLTVVEATFEFHLGALVSSAADSNDKQRAGTRVQTAAKYLRQALELSGVGAKTGAGYGRFVFETKQSRSLR